VGALKAGSGGPPELQMHWFLEAAWRKRGLKKRDLQQMPWKEVRDLVEILSAEAQVSRMGNERPDPSPSLIRAMKGQLGQDLPPAQVPPADPPTDRPRPRSGLVPKTDAP